MKNYFRAKPKIKNSEQIFSEYFWTKYLPWIEVSASEILTWRGLAHRLDGKEIPMKWGEWRWWYVYRRQTIQSKYVCKYVNRKIILERNRKSKTRNKFFWITFLNKVSALDRSICFRDSYLARPCPPNDGEGITMKWREWRWWYVCRRQIVQSM